jgi:hypothetical protein
MLQVKTLSEFIKIADMQLNVAYSKKGINNKIKSLGLKVNRDLKTEIFTFFKCW